MNNKKTMKTLVFWLGLASMMLTATNLNAQNDGSRGMFGRGIVSRQSLYGNREESLLRQGEPTVYGDIQNDDFGAPLGSGIAILIGAGLGYVALKKKEDKQ